MRLIPLHRRDGSVRCHAMVDDEDYADLARFRWFYDGKYAARKDGKKNVRLHRHLLGLGRGDRRDVDHINRVPLDNRRANLRVVSHAENCRNAPAQPGSSRHRGVVWDKARQRWKAQARYDYRMYHLGRFDTELEAAAAVHAFWSTKREAQEPLPYGDESPFVAQADSQVHA